MKMGDFMHSEREMTFGVSQFDRFVNEGERERRELSLESVWLWVGPTKRERRERVSLGQRRENQAGSERGETRKRKQEKEGSKRGEKQENKERENLKGINKLYDLIKSG